MAEKDFVSAFGLGEEALRAMGKLARQITNQGGQEEDVRLIGNERILQRVAKVLARAGQLTRKFSVNGGGGFEGWVEIFLVSFDIKTIDELGGALESWGMSRLANANELLDLCRRYPGFLQDENDLIIVGEHDDKDVYFVVAEVAKGGVIRRHIPSNEVITPDKFLFALIL